MCKNINIEIIVLLIITILIATNPLERGCFSEHGHMWCTVVVNLCHKVLG
jgi:hypothetical protein